MNINKYIDIIAGKSNIVESVIDPPHNKRADWLFDENEKIKPEVKKQIYSILREWKKQINFPFDIDKIELKGSCLGFQYTPESDIDVGVFTTMSKEQRDKIIDISPSGNKLKVDGKETLHPIDFYFLAKGEEVPEKNLDNIYDLAENKWIKKTEKYSMKIPYTYALQVATFFINGCDLAVSQYLRDKKEFEMYKELDTEEQDISEEEKKTALSRKLQDLKADIDQMRIISHLISGFRHEAYQDEPFRISIDLENSDKENPHLSINEAITKILERYGYRDRLRELSKYGEQFIKKNEIE